MSNDVHKEILKEELKKELIGILIEELQEKLKENTQNQLKEYQDNIKKNEKTQKQLNEIREDFNKFHIFKEIIKRKRDKLSKEDSTRESPRWQLEGGSRKRDS
jgi:esterase/lipase